MGGYEAIPAETLGKSVAGEVGLPWFQSIIDPLMVLVMSRSMNTT